MTRCQIRLFKLIYTCLLENWPCETETTKAKSRQIEPNFGSDLKMNAGNTRTHEYMVTFHDWPSSQNFEKQLSSRRIHLFYNFIKFGCSVQFSSNLGFNRGHANTWIFPDLRRLAQVHFFEPPTITTHMDIEELDRNRKLQLQPQCPVIFGNWMMMVQPSPGVEFPSVELVNDSDWNEGRGLKKSWNLADSQE